MFCYSEHQFQMELSQVETNIGMRIKVIELHLLCLIVTVIMDNEIPGSTLKLHFNQNYCTFVYYYKWRFSEEEYILKGKQITYENTCTHNLDIKTKDDRALYLEKCIVATEGIIDIEKNEGINNKIDLKDLKNFEWHLNNFCTDLRNIINNLAYPNKITDFQDIFLKKNNNHPERCPVLVFKFNVLRNLHIYMNDLNYPLELKDHFLKNVKYLELLKLNCGANTIFDIDIHKEAFQNLQNLRELEIQSCRNIILTSLHFTNLTNLRSLHFKNIIFPDFEWLRSETLQSNLEDLNLINATTVLHNYTTLQYLSKFKKLNIIEVSAQRSFEYLFTSDSPIKPFICLSGMESCEFKLDVDNRPCPNDCKCTFDRQKMCFKIECYGFRQEIPELPVPIIDYTSLYFNNTNLTKLPKSNLYGYWKVSELHLANNKLNRLSFNHLPKNLTYLDIRNNSLQTLDKRVLEFLSNRSSYIRILLSGNPWICNCNLQTYILDNSNEVMDRQNITCRDAIMGYITQISKSSDCKTDTLKIVIIIGTFSVIIVILLTYFYYKELILIWLYERKFCLCCVARNEPDNVEKSDAFLAFSHQDLNLAEEYVEKLEKGPNQYQLFFYHRDWLIGESISDCILRSIEDSKRIIILLTENFVKSSWGRFEFRSAIKAISTDQNKRLLVILYPRVDINDLDSELRSYMKFNTYLRRDDPQFWRKLMFGMPHKGMTTVTCTDTDV